MEDLIQEFPAFFASHETKPTLAPYSFIFYSPSCDTLFPEKYRIKGMTMVCGLRTAPSNESDSDFNARMAGIALGAAAELQQRGDADKAQEAMDLYLYFLDASSQ